MYLVSCILDLWSVFGINDPDLVLNIGELAILCH